MTRQRVLIVGAMILLVAAFLVFAITPLPDCGSSGRPDLMAACARQVEADASARLLRLLAAVTLGLAGTVLLVMGAVRRRPPNDTPAPS